MSEHRHGKVLHVIRQDEVTSGKGGACTSQTPQSAEASAVDGGKLFARACAKCHGVDGTGGLPMAVHGPKPIDFRDSAWQSSRTNMEIASAIRDGRGAMPPFNDLLKPEDVTALTEYVRQLGVPTRSR